MNRSDKHNLTRRQFIRGTFFALGGGILAACGADIREVAQPWQTPTAYRVLQSPVPAETETPASAEDAELMAFLALSSLLTGFEPLMPEVGRVYLNSLQNHAELDMSFADFIDLTGMNTNDPPGTLADLEARGIFEDDASSTVAETILTYWYTGIYQTANGEAVATYVDSLAWKSVPQIKPRTICGAPGFWAENPEERTS